MAGTSPDKPGRDYSEANEGGAASQSFASQRLFLRENSCFCRRCSVRQSARDINQMRTTFLAAGAAALLSFISFNAHAFPAAASASGQSASGLILVEGGCGQGRHRDRFGVCIRNIGAPVVVEPVVPGVVV